MASSSSWSEFNGSGAATETASAADANWKNADNCTNGAGGQAYTAVPIPAGSNSFPKYQSLVFAQGATGGNTWDSLSAFTYAIGPTNQPGSAYSQAITALSGTSTTTWTATVAATAGLQNGQLISTTGTATGVTGGTSSNWINNNLRVLSVTSGTQFTFTVAGGGTGGAYSGTGMTVTSNSLNIVGSVVTSGTTPATTDTGDALMSTTGLSANFVGSTTPYGAGASSTTSNSGKVYVQCLRTQLQVSSDQVPGTISSSTITASWTES